MWWWYLILAAILYSVFKKEIVRKLKDIEKWYKANKDKIEEWGKNAEIKKAWEELSDAIKRAQLDRKWTAWEIIEVLGLASHLFNLIKDYEQNKRSI